MQGVVAQEPYARLLRAGGLFRRVVFFVEELLESIEVAGNQLTALWHRQTALDKIMASASTLKRGT